MTKSLNLSAPARKLDRQADPRHGQIKGLLDAYWSAENPSIPSLPWGAGDAGALGAFLRANPTLTVDTVKACLLNRLHSEDHAAGERVMVWIGHVLRYAASPLNRFGQPMRIASEATVGMRKPEPIIERPKATMPPRPETIREQMGEEWFERLLRRKHLNLELYPIMLNCLKEEKLI